jgi:hypothetical protein
VSIFGDLAPRRPHLLTTNIHLQDDNPSFVNNKLFQSDVKTDMRNIAGKAIQTIVVIPLASCLSLSQALCH